jgi:hypothetical protein
MGRCMHGSVCMFAHDDSEIGLTRSGNAFMTYGHMATDYVLLSLQGLLQQTGSLLSLKGLLQQTGSLLSLKGFATTDRVTFVFKGFATTDRVTFVFKGFATTDRITFVFKRVCYTTDRVTFVFKGFATTDRVTFVFKGFATTDRITFVFDAFCVFRRKVDALQVGHCLFQLLVSSCLESFLCQFWCHGYCLSSIPLNHVVPRPPLDPPPPRAPWRRPQMASQGPHSCSLKKSVTCL